MKPPIAEPRVLDSVESEAHAWLRRSVSGEMSHAEGEALARWCRADPAHALALRSASVRWEQLRAAGHRSLERQPTKILWRDTQADSASRWQRRAFLSGAVGAVAAVSTAALVVPPLGLWPSVDELQADFRTGTGEQRQVALGEDVSVQLNTRTSISVWDTAATANGMPGIDLIAGETAVDMLREGAAFVVRAGAGRVVAKGADGARFEVRHVAQGVCVSCIEGRVQIVHATGTAWLEGSERRIYDKRAIGSSARIDPVQVSAWRDGYLRFVDTPLRDVVSEINRYRPGQVIVVNAAMAAKAVTGRFHIHSLDKAIVQMQHALGLAVRSLPGGVVLLG